MCDSEGDELPRHQYAEDYKSQCVGTLILVVLYAHVAL